MSITRNLTTEDLITKLKSKKIDILKQQQNTINKMANFFTNIRYSLDQCQRQSNNKFEQDLLNFQEKVNQIIGVLNNKHDSQYISIVNQYANFCIFDGPKIDQNKLVQLLTTVYTIKIGNQHKFINNQENFDYPTVSQSQSQNSEIVKNSNDFVLQKLQDERDYYQRRQIQLLQRIKDLQNQMNRKGINIKEMSKSYLEEKCSKWAIQRIRQQNKILVQKIGEASQQIMRQNTQLSEYQSQIKRLYLLLGQQNGKSYIINTSSLKTNSMIIQPGMNYRGSQISLSRQRQSQLQMKNQQLRIQINNHIKRFNDQIQINSDLRLQIQQYEQQIHHLQQVKAQYQQRINAVKKQKESIKVDAEQEIKRCKEQHAKVIHKMTSQKQILENQIKSLQNNKTQLLSKYRQYQLMKRQQISKNLMQISQLTQQKEQLLFQINQFSIKKGQEINNKNLLNDEISRLIRQIEKLKKQITNRQDELFMGKEEMIKLQNQIKEVNSKWQQSKKEISKIKKINRDLQKENIQIKNKLTETENVEIKISQMQHNYHLLQAEFFKLKQTSQKRMSLNDKIMTIIKQKHTYQLNAILAEQIKTKNKKGGSKCETIEKYIEEMMNFANKSAMVKQLKEEIRQLKQNKESKSSIKKTKGNYEDLASIQSGILNLGNKILQQRLKSQKQLYEQKVKQLRQLLSKEEIIKSNLLSQLNNQKQNNSSLKNKLKQQDKIQQTNRITKQSQQKLQRIQEQLKRLRNKLKKTENDLNDTQCQLKIKKELITNCKNQLKLKQDTIIIQQKQIIGLKSQIQKNQRNLRQQSNKQDLLKQSKQYQKKLQAHNDQLTQQLLQYQEKVRQLTRNLGKKEQAIKQYKNIEQKEVKIRQQGRIRELNNTIVQKNEQIKKLKNEVDRKDEIIKNHKSKIQHKNKEFEEISYKNQKDYQKILKQKDSLQRKNENLNNFLKKEELKNQSFVYLIKRIFQINCTQIKEEKCTSNNNRFSTQYHTGNSAISYNNYKIGTPASNMKSLGICQGLQILNLRPQDIQSCLNIQQTITSKAQKNDNSWSITSPILNKRRQHDKQMMLTEGLQQLQKLLHAKQLNNDLILKQFKNIIN